MEVDENTIKKSFWRYAVIAAVICLVFMFMRRDNVLIWIQTRHTLNQQEKRIEALKEDNVRLDSRIEDLVTNRDSLEKFARETYGFCSPEEDVYIDE
ncbi:MAG: septum formation initiator family protein [Bacteroidales bacterium]|nr:septum formation initiator family protein [Bacteroidales bacterium]